MAPGSTELLRDYGAKLSQRSASARIALYSYVDFRKIDIQIDIQIQIYNKGEQYNILEYILYHCQFIFSSNIFFQCLLGWRSDKRIEANFVTLLVKRSPRSLSLAVSWISLTRCSVSLCQQLQEGNVKQRLKLVLLLLCTSRSRDSVCSV